MQKLAELPRELNPLFLTLTYPKEFPSDAREWKRHLDMFSKRFVRQFGMGFMIWKLEFQKRGAPHYHCLVFGVEYQELLSWAGENWYQVVDSGDEKHLKAGTRVEWLRSIKGGFRYAAKYMSKEDPISGVGRFWGIVARDRFNEAAVEPVIITLSDQQAVQALRYMRRFANLPTGRAYKALTILCDAEFWYLALDIWRPGNYHHQIQ